MNPEVIINGLKWLLPIIIPMIEALAKSTPTLVDDQVVAFLKQLLVNPAAVHAAVAEVNKAK